MRRSSPRADSGISDARGYQAIGQHLDLPEFVDYLILNLYAGNSDWDRSANWCAARPRIPSGKFQFFVWDAERTLEELAADTTDFDDDESPPRSTTPSPSDPVLLPCIATKRS